MKVLLLQYTRLAENVQRQNNSKIYICFVDFRKAFDSVWHDGFFLKLLENRVGGKFYDIIKNLYHRTECAIKLSERHSFLLREAFVKDAY